MSNFNMERKRRKVAEESNEEQEARLERDQKRKRRKVAEETNEEHETRLARDQKGKIPEETHEEYEARLEAEEEVRCAHARNKYQLRKAREIFKQFVARLSQNKPNIRRKRVLESSGSIQTSDRKLLREVLQELQDLTNIEEMLIVQVFPIVSVYNLPGGQHYTENGSNFRDFHVQWEKVMQALQWLKANNKFYQDIKIDSDVLQTLPENDSIEMHLSQLIDDNDRPNE
ncbi:hypothetical protein C1646_672911 [Rhizophagus diaphanus]|nr:hypothetical protein C1646_672911 [Rhizophagus diaphanus] [Rhizophagus sp. MUCL 43196]